MRKTKIVCTIGPASNSYEKIMHLIKEGMDVARLNFSHGNYEEHLMVINYIRRASDLLDKPVAILQDLEGPKIRIGKIKQGSILLKKDAQFILTTRGVAGDETEVSVTYLDLPRSIKKGQRIFLADGTMELRVKEITSTDIICKVIKGGKLSSHKGINIPDLSTRISSLTEKDYQNILFGIKHKVDFIGLSFIRSAEDVNKVKNILKEKGAEDIAFIFFVPLNHIFINTN